MGRMAATAAQPDPVAGLAGELADLVGPAQVLVDPDMRAPFEQDWTRRFGGPAALVVRPGSTNEVAGVVRSCSARGVGVVPQGGNTGLVGGGVPSRGGRPVVVLSLARLARIDPVDTVAAQVTAGAGVTLTRLHEAAAAAGLAFGVDFAARDSATVGGMIATNAGGLHVMRFGPMRAQVLGVEAVLADGTVVSRLSGLVKDNTGYDLAQLVVGSEGTLAVVTAARLRLVRRDPERVVALLGLPGTSDALAVLDTMRRRVEGLQAVELFYQEGLELVCSHGGLAPPLPETWPAYLVVECRGAVRPQRVAVLGARRPGSAGGGDGRGHGRIRAGAPVGIPRTPHRSDLLDRRAPQAGRDPAPIPPRRVRGGGAAGGG